MAELGESTDPRVLVPGDAAGIDEAVTRWRRQASMAEEVSGRLVSLGVPEGWTGRAAEAFESRVTSTAARWARVREALVAAASALEGYASTLLWARAQAESAVDLWERAARL